MVVLEKVEKISIRRSSQSPNSSPEPTTNKVNIFLNTLIIS